MIPYGDIELGKISTPPSTLLFPLLSTLISDPENAEERNQEILIEGVANKANIPIPHLSEEAKRVDPRQIAAVWAPGPGVDEGEILALVSDAVPCVSVEGAGVVVERFARPLERSQCGIESDWEVEEEEEEEEGVLREMKEERK
ncbi:hypothetical protein Ahy_A03g011783 isoform B [Arachis hypogaea]|uniref:Uncharacterized protein n=1 Tax=Arachis hypogaea TaxID=3818 RepID=A0A445DRR2_ARAHY|nr:hypothetical protein Ahy_A03g011783 isoform B [Arachis hypogaea]